MMSTAATQAGPGWIASHQIAEGIIGTIVQKKRDGDRVSLWTVNAPESTRNISKDFLLPTDPTDGKRLHNVLSNYRKKEYPVGTTDLKNALTQALQTFDGKSESQRILLFLGDGLSTHNPMDEKERLAIARQMVERKIAFFPVPLGTQLNPETLHGLANATGGAVLRTRVEAEKLVDALKRYEEAFACPILYKADLQLPAAFADVCPAILPPLRSDSPTLVVGRIKGDVKQLDFTVTGFQAGRKAELAVQATEKILAPNLDNFFLVGMIDQWSKAKDFPATLRADRALGIAYENTRLQHLNLLDSAQMALEEGKFAAAHNLFKQAKTLSPADGQADAGIKIVDRLTDGSLTINQLRKQMEKRPTKVDQLKVVAGKQQWVKADLVQIANDDKLPVNPKVAPKDGGVGPEDLIKEHRDRQAVEEQKVSNAVDDAIAQARRTLALDPDGTLDLLRNLLNRVKDHPDLGGQIRDKLATRLQSAYGVAAKDAKGILDKKRELGNVAAVVQANMTADQERKTFVERVESQFRVFKNLMNTGRYEEKTKVAILEAMVQISDEAKMRGMAAPVAAQAVYGISLAAGPFHQNQSLIRQREEKWLAVMMSIEKSHMPYPDEPGIYFPPLQMWKAILKARKDKYSVTTLPNDETALREATEINKLLQMPIETKGLQEKVKLKTALEYFSDKFGGKLPILVDRDAFADERAEAAPDPYEEEVSLPPVPKTMIMSTALRLILAQVGKGKATYLIRREFVEITTNDRYIQDKVLRVYPVGDLAMPISSGPQGMTGGFAGGGGQLAAPK